MQCPRDQTAMGATSVSGARQCLECHGLWIGKTTLRQRWPELYQAVRQKWSKRRFPAGCGCLALIVYRRIHLDLCPACGGIWFDAGEIERVLRLRNEVSPIGLPEASDTDPVIEAVKVVGPAVVDGVYLAVNVVGPLLDFAAEAISVLEAL